MQLSYENVSDIICIIDNYDKKNMMTGKVSRDLDEVIRKDRRFLVIEVFSGMYTLKKIHGYALIYDKGNDTLLLGLYDLEEDEYGLIHWAHKASYSFDRHSMSVDFPMLTGYFCDIYGQTPIDHRFKSHPYLKAACGSKKAIFDYIGGNPIIWHEKYRNISMYMDFDGLYDINQLVKFIRGERGRGEIDKEKLVFGKILKRDVSTDTVSFTSAKMKLPKNAEKAMIKFFMMPHESMKMEERKCAILQKCGSRAVLRSFKPSIYYQYPIEDSVVELQEFSRVEFRNNLMPLKYIEEMSNELVWCDNMEGTVFEHTEHILNYMLKHQNKGRKFIEKYGVNETFAVALAFYIGCQPMLESLLKVADAATSKTIYQTLAETDGNLNFVFWKHDFSKKKLHQAFCLPKGALEYAFNRTIDVFELKKMQKLFDKKDTWDMFLHMNADDLQFLVEKFFVEIRRGGGGGLAFNAMSDMMDIWGCRNWKAYAAFLSEICRDYDYMREYKYLIQSAHNVWNSNDSVIDIKDQINWKIERCEIEEIKEKIEVLSYVYQSDYEETVAKYKNNKRKWDSFAYSDEKFSIIAPSSPEDVIREGASLHHCLAQFVEKLADDKTLVLFIRRNENPDKPFFSMEIRDVKVRQCHGVCNCNMTIEVAEFVKKFCEEKHVIYTDGEQQLGAD